MDYYKEIVDPSVERFDGLWTAEDYLRKSQKLKAKAERLAKNIIRDEAMLESLMWMLSKKERLAINIEMGIQKALYVEKMEKAAAMQLQYVKILKENEVLIELYREPTVECLVLEVLPAKSH